MPILLRQWSDRYNGKDLPRLRIKKIDGISRDVGYRHGFATIDRQYMVGRCNAEERLSRSKVRSHFPRVQIKNGDTLLCKVKAPRRMIERCIIPNAVGAAARNRSDSLVRAPLRLTGYSGGPEHYKHANTANQL